MSEENVPKKVIVIGAGTAGIFCAMALLKKGIDVVVYDQTQVFDEHRGVEVSFGVISQICLQTLGFDVSDLLREVALEVESVKVFDWEGNVLKSFPVEKEFNLATFSIRRGVLMNMLLKLLEKAAGGKQIVQWDHRLTQLEQQEDSVNCQFTQRNGEKVNVSASFVVGADGLWSSTRKLVFDTTPPEFIGASIQYGLVKGHSLLSEDSSSFNLVMAEKYSFVTCAFLSPTREKETWWCLVFPCEEVKKKDGSSVWDVEFDSVKTTKEHLLQSSDLGKKYLEATHTFSFAGGFYRRHMETLPSWSKGRVVLIGDAVHAMLPWGGYGCNMAMEDGYCLVDQWEKAGWGNYQKGFAAYQEIRYPRLKSFDNSSKSMAPKGFCQEIEDSPLIKNMNIQDSPAFSDWEKSQMKNK